MNKESKIFITLILGCSLAVIFLILLLIFSGTNINQALNQNQKGNAVAIIPIEGQIAFGQTDGGELVVTPEQIRQAIKQAEEDNGVSSILIEMNSPGGSAVASEEMMEAIKSAKKPVVVWISDAGASGAYLAATSADKIIASPSSIVGSIGVLMDITDLSEYYQNLGINKYSIKAGEYKDMGADYRPLTPEETKMLQNMVNEDYDRFITLVAQNRNLDKNYVSTIAQGKIYTGTQAKNNKLVDDVGGQKHALDVAAELGGIKGEYNVISISTSNPLMDFINSLIARASYSLGKGIGNYMHNGSIQYILN